MKYSLSEVLFLAQYLSFLQSSSPGKFYVPFSPSSQELSPRHPHLSFLWEQRMTVHLSFTCTVDVPYLAPHLSVSLIFKNYLLIE